MRSVILAVCLLTFSACASLPDQKAFCGIFSHASIDADLELWLNADGTYAEYFLNGAEMRQMPNGDFGFPMEKRSNGRWELSGHEIVLSPDRGAKRRLHALEKDGVLVLRERSTTYRKMREESPNQPLRMPVSGTPAAGAPVAPPPGIAGR